MSYLVVPVVLKLPKDDRRVALRRAPRFERLVAQVYDVLRPLYQSARGGNFTVNLYQKRFYTHSNMH